MLHERTAKNGRILRSIEKGKGKEAFETQKTSSRGRRIDRSSQKMGEGITKHNETNAFKAKNDDTQNDKSQASLHSNTSTKKSNNFRSKKKQPLSKSRSNEKNVEQKLINKQDYRYNKVT